MISIKNKIKKNKYLSYLYLELKIFLIKTLNSNTKRFYKEINNRRGSSIFDYYTLAEDLPKKNNISYFDENSYYGNDIFITKIVSKKKRLIYYIEHGYFFGGYVVEYPLYYNDVSIITYSVRRLKHIKNKFAELLNAGDRINVITIGPYINYADSVLDKNEKLKIKGEHRKVLLVFPSHSIEGVIYKYDTQDFINEIEKVSKDFDSVFVCMYWKDIQDNRHVEYENKGYKIVTAGHRNDPNFLGRLKDIIDLSDMTMSNTVGTHIGYCLARNKPHYYFDQFQKIEGKKVDEEFKERNNQEYIRTRDEEVKEVTEAFSNISYIITDEQKRVVEKYWGKNKVEYHTVEKKESHND